jgi:hypothetical protein
MTTLAKRASSRRNVQGPREFTKSVSKTAEEGKPEIWGDVLDMFSPVKRPALDREKVSRRGDEVRDPKKMQEDADGRKMKRQHADADDRMSKRFRESKYDKPQPSPKSYSPTSKKSSLESTTTHRRPEVSLEGPVQRKPLGLSAKDNLPQQHSPRKSILKDTIKYHPSDNAKLELSPRHRRDSQDKSLHTPVLESESPFVPPRRIVTEPVSSTPDAHVTPATKSPRKEYPSPAKHRIPDSLSQAPTFRPTLPRPSTQLPTSQSHDLTTAVTELQTVMRGEVERLRMDMIRQFITFKTEMGRKWDSEVVALRRENEGLREELLGLKRREMERKGSSSWKLG